MLLLLLPLQSFQLQAILVSLSLSLVFESRVCFIRKLIRDPGPHNFLLTVFCYFSC